MNGFRGLPLGICLRPSRPCQTWDKSWAYLKELGSGIDYYPGGTTPTMKELGEGTRDVVVSTCGWDINPRALGIVPKGPDLDFAAAHDRDRFPAAPLAKAS